LQFVRNIIRWFTGSPLWLQLPLLLACAFVLVGLVAWHVLDRVTQSQIEQDTEDATRYRTNLIQAFWIDAILTSDRPAIDRGLKALGASDPNIHRMDMRDRNGTSLGTWIRSPDVALMRSGNMVNIEAIKFDERVVGHFTIEWDARPYREARLATARQMLRLFILGSLGLVGLLFLINHLMLIKPLRFLMHKVTRLHADAAEHADDLDEPTIMPAELRRLSATIEDAEVLLEEQTEQKLALATAENKQQLAEEAALAKANFLSTMSHEIRTPLTAILGYAEMIDESPLAVEDQEGLEMIQKSGLHLKRIADDILDFSKLDANRLMLSPEPFRIREFLEEAILTETPRAEKRNVEIRLELAPETPPIINTDRVRLKQVLLNLLSNAVKFTQNGTVDVRTIALAPRPSPDGKSPARPMLGIEVEDTGAGIPAEALESVFRPYSQVEVRRDRDKGGAGLGLAISQKLVGLMGGTIEVESEVGVGTTMQVSILADMKGAKKDAGKLAKFDKTMGERVPHKILIAEDNPVNQRLLQQTFKRFGYHSKPDHRFTVVFIDLNMPVLDGVETIKRIRQGAAGDRYRNLAASALTADVLASTEWRDWGFDDYLLKPLENEKICKFLTRTTRAGDGRASISANGTGSH